MGLECRGVSQDCYKPVLREKAAPKLVAKKKMLLCVPEVVAKKTLHGQFIKLKLDISQWLLS